MLRKMNPFDRRKHRVRRNLARNAGGRPRVSVFRSSKHIYAQIIDDAKGRTVAAASSLEKDMKGKDALQLQVGFSHEVVHKIPAGVDIKVAGAKQEIIEVSGIDKQKVGQMAAVIRATRPPEPYQGKGIRYRGEYIHRKEGKKK